MSNALAQVFCDIGKRCIISTSAVILFIRSATSDEFCPGYRTPKYTYEKGFWCKGEETYCCGTHSNPYCCCDCQKSLILETRQSCKTAEKDDPSCSNDVPGTVAGIVGGALITAGILFILTLICCKKGRPRGGIVFASRKNSRVNPLGATEEENATPVPLLPPPYSVHPTRPQTPPPAYRPPTAPHIRPAFPPTSEGGATIQTSPSGPHNMQIWTLQNMYNDSFPMTPPPPYLESDAAYPPVEHPMATRIETPTHSESMQSATGGSFCLTKF